MIKKILLPKIIELKKFYQLIQDTFSNSFYLEIGAGPDKSPDYCYIGFDPIDTIEYNNADTIDHFFDYVRNTLNKFNINEFDPSFQGGFVGFFSYDFIRSIESLPDSASEDKKYPDALFGLFLDGVVADFKNEQIYYFFHQKFKNRIEFVQHLLSRLQNEYDPVLQFYSEELTFELSEQDFITNVRLIKDKITEGETFQTVLSQRGFVNYIGNPFKVFLELCQINPSPYLFYFDFKGEQLFGSSPETLLFVKDRKIRTFPIAGTRKIDNYENLEFLSKDLLQDPKELAEHNMLVDLGRNDLGKVSEIGSVNVPSYMEIQKLRHVIHIKSIVEGTLRTDCDCLDAFRAVFPAGTVSGAPKVRSMEIIESMEKIRRGPYAGAVGFISLNYDLDMAITIRSFYTHKNKLFFQAGAGIVYDSDPKKEFDETMSKLRSLLVSIKNANKEVLLA